MDSIKREISMSGKGSKQRPTNKVEFDKNFDNIFGNKDTKVSKPTGKCDERVKRKAVIRGN